jgi:hypothetical protein
MAWMHPKTVRQLVQLCGNCAKTPSVWGVGSCCLSESSFPKLLILGTSVWSEWTDWSRRIFFVIIGARGEAFAGKESRRQTPTNQLDSAKPSEPARLCSSVNSHLCQASRCIAGW